MAFKVRRVVTNATLSAHDNSYLTILSCSWGLESCVFLVNKNIVNLGTSGSVCRDKKRLSMPFGLFNRFRVVEGRSLVRTNNKS